LTHTFFVLVTVGLGHGVYRKLHILIGGQRAETMRTTEVNEDGHRIKNVCIQLLAQQGIKGPDTMANLV